MLDALSDPAAEERVVAASLCTTGRVWAERLDPGSITDPQLAKVAAAVASVAGGGSAITPFSVAKAMGDTGQEAWLDALVVRHGDISAPDAFATVEEMRLRREVAGACKRAYEEAIDLDREITGTLSRAEGSLIGVASRTPAGGGPGVQRGGDFTSVQENFRWRVANPGKIRGMSMGFPEMEQMLDGMHRGRTYIVGARPSIGKSALGKDFVEHFLLAGRRVLTFTLEMSADEYRERLVSSVSGVPTGSLRAMPYTPGEIATVEATYSRMSYADWHIDDTPGLTVDAMRRKARSVARGGALDLVLVDYIQLMRGSEGRSHRDRRIEVGEISAATKALSKELRCPVVALAQLRRPSTEVYDRETKTYGYPPPRLSDLKEAGNIEEDADGVILIDREGEPRLIVAKNRGGPVGDVSVEWLPELTKFRE